MSSMFVRIFASIPIFLLLTLSVLAGPFEDGMDAYEVGDYAEALVNWRQAAEEGDANAQLSIGFMYYNGNGVPQDNAEALKWYRLAAEQGNAGALFNIGRMYREGEGVAQDNAEAVKWIRQAAKLGNADAQFNIGYLYDSGEGVAQDVSEAAKWYQLAAEQGNADAQFNIGLMYRSGEGVAQDSTEAAKWYRLAAEQGNVRAQSNIGFMYYSGEGVAQDSAEAVKWFRLAAEQGHAGSQFNIGYMYDNGEGVAQDNTEAAKWYLQAAEQGNANAQLSIGIMYYKGEGVAQDSVEAVRWYRQAAEQGNPNAQISIGVMYYSGEGVVQDYAEAANWLRTATEQLSLNEQQRAALAEASLKADVDAALAARGLIQPDQIGQLSVTQRAQGLNELMTKEAEFMQQEGVFGKARLRLDQVQGQAFRLQTENDWMLLPGALDVARAGLKDMHMAEKVQAWLEGGIVNEIQMAQAVLGLPATGQIDRTTFEQASTYIRAPYETDINKLNFVRYVAGGINTDMFYRAANEGRIYVPDVETEEGEQMLTSSGMDNFDIEDITFAPKAKEIREIRLNLGALAPTNEQRELLYSETREEIIASEYRSNPALYTAVIEARNAIAATAILDLESPDRPISAKQQ